MAVTAGAQRLRDDPNFRRYWWSRVLSTSGTVITLISLPVLVYRMTGSPLLTAAVSSLEAAPYVSFGLFAGALSDRLDRRRVMIRADLCNAALMASIPLAHWLGVLTTPQVLVVAFASPAIEVFFDGANFGALPVLVGRGRIAQANAAVFGASTAVETVLPSVVGVALAVLSPATLMALDALSFAASAMFVRAISRLLQDADRRPTTLTWSAVFSDIGEGVRYLVRHPGVRTMTVIGALQCLAGGGFVALMVIWCDRVLGVGTSGWRFGLVFTAWSVGALVAAVALPRVLTHATPARITLWALPPSAGLGIVTPLAPDWQLACAALFAWSCVYTLVTINTISYRQQVTPEHLLGRVNTVGRMLAWGVGWTTGALAGGILGNAVGVRTAMVVMTALVVPGVLIAWLSPLPRLAHEAPIPG